MAYEQFGNPITDETLKAMPEYKDKTITRRDRAHEAMRMKNAEEKDVNARKYVEKLKADWGIGVSTLCLLYNATGDPINYAYSHDWWGHIGPSPYPMHLENGQWGAFLHVKTSGTATGSQAAVVYRGQNEDGNTYDWMLCWMNPWNRMSYNNHAYTEIRDVDFFERSGIWDAVESNASNAVTEHRDESFGGLSVVSMGNDTSPIYQAILTQHGLA